MLRYWSLGLCLLLGSQLCAQGHLDLIKVTYGHGLNNTNYDRYSLLRLTAQMPIVLKNKDVVPLGFAMGASELAQDQIDFQPRTLRFSVGYRRKINDETSVTLMTIHRMNSDGFRLAADNYQFGVIGLFTYRDKPGPMLQFGFYTNTEFLGQFFTPLFGLDWEINPRIRFFGVLPINGTLQVIGNDRLRYGVNFVGVFATYKMHELGDVYLQENYNQLSLYADLYLSNQLVINVKAGYRLGSNSRLYRSEDEIDLALNLVRIGDNRTELQSLKTDGLIISAGLAFRYQIPSGD